MCQNKTEKLNFAALSTYNYDAGGKIMDFDRSYSILTTTTTTTTTIFGTDVICSWLCVCSGLSLVSRQVLRTLLIIRNRVKKEALTAIWFFSLSFFRFPRIILQGVQRQFVGLHMHA